MNTLFKIAVVAGFLAAGAGAADPAPAAAESSPLTIESLVALVPADVRLKSGGKWQAVSLARATEAMRAKGLHAQAEFKIKVAALTPDPVGGHSVSMHSKPALVAINGTQIPYVANVFFDADSLATLGKVRVGDSVTVSGVLNKADIESNGNTATLTCALLQAKLKPPAAKP